MITAYKRRTMKIKRLFIFTCYLKFIPTDVRMTVNYCIPLLGYVCPDIFYLLSVFTHTNGVFPCPPVGNAGFSRL